MAKIFTDKIFEAILNVAKYEDEFVEECHKILGTTLDTLPCSDWTFDYYDHSFELLNVHNGYTLSPDQLIQFWALGFARCWLRYQDGSEMHYAMNGNGKGTLKINARKPTFLESEEIEYLRGKKENVGLRARVMELEAAHLRCFNDLNLCAGKLIDTETQLAAEAQSCEELIAGRLIALARIDHLELRVCEVVDERDALVIRLATSEAARVKAEEDKEKVHANTMQYAKAIEDAGLLLSCRPTGYKIINDPGTAYKILLLRARDAEQERDTAIRERAECEGGQERWNEMWNEQRDELEQLQAQLTRIRTALPAERAREIANEIENLLDCDEFASDVKINSIRSYADILEDAEKTEPLSDALQAANKRAEVAEAALHQVDEILVVNWAGPRKDGDYRKALADLVSFNIKIYDDPQVSEVAAKRKQHLEDLERQNAELRAALGRARKEVVNVYDRLGHGNLESASALIGLAVVDIDKALASAPVEPQGEPAVKAQAFLDTFSRLGESNAEAARRFNEYEPTGTADDQIPRETVEAIPGISPRVIRSLNRRHDYTSPEPTACPNCAGPKKALEELVVRLEEVHEDPRYEAVWISYQTHGGRYTEPTYTKQLASAKALLSGSGQEEK